MRRIHWVLLAIGVVLVLGVVYVLVAKPTVVLPTQTVTLAADSPLLAYQRQLKINELHLRVRSDGKAFVVADGQELAQVGYTPATLLNSLHLAEKMVLSPTAAQVLRWLPLLFPDWSSSLLTTGLTVYYVLPVEMTIRFIPG